MAYVDDSGGTFNGFIGFGGVTPSYIMHVQHDAENSKLAFFRNTATNGYGVKIQNGIDTNYGLKIASAADDDAIQLYGDGRVTLHGSNEMVAFVNTPESTFVNAMIHANSADRGWRFNYNYVEPYVDGDSFGEDSLFQISFGVEQDGAFYLNYDRPHTDSAGTYDTSGKAFAIHPGGFDNTGQTAQFADLLSRRANRGVRFGACAVVDTPTWMIQLDPATDASNPVSVYVGGSLRKVVVDGSGFLKVA